MLRKSYTFYFYSDASHGWMKCPLKIIFELGLADKVSSCSYIREQYAYLEEDCDAPLIINALKSHGIKVKLRGASYANERQSRIRNYNSFKLDSQYFSIVSRKFNLV